MAKKRIIVGISGASGSKLGVEVLRLLLSEKDVESHLVITPNSHPIIKHETGLTLQEIIRMADYYYETDNLMAPIASGSFITMGILIIPCSMNTAASIACGLGNNLLLRAAQVCIKEHRKVVLVPRESPISSINLENLLKLSQNGAIIMPPCPAFYLNLSDMNEAITQLALRALACFSIYSPEMKVWEEEKHDI